MYNANDASTLTQGITTEAYIMFENNQSQIRQLSLQKYLDSDWTPLPFKFRCQHTTTIYKWDSHIDTFYYPHALNAFGAGKSMCENILTL